MFQIIQKIPIGAIMNNGPVSAAFPIGRAVKLIKTGVNVTNSTSPLTLTKNITLAVIDCCTPPPVRLTAHCIGAAGVIAAAVVSPNPITIGSAIHLVTEIYDEC